jgi:hypothetical protein
MRQIKRLAAVFISCGLGLLVYGLMSFQAGGGPIGNTENLIGWYIRYPIDARLEAAIGALLLTAGCLFRQSYDSARSDP